MSKLWGSLQKLSKVVISDAMPFSLSKSVCPSPLLKNFVLIVPPFSIYGLGLQQPPVFIHVFRLGHKKSVKPLNYCPLHVLRPLGMCPVCRSEQRRSPTPICITICYTDSSIGVGIHQWLSRHSRYVYSTPTGHLPLPCF